MQNRSRRTILEIVAFILLVAWLVVVSARQQNTRNFISQPLQQIQGQLQQLKQASAGTTKIYTVKQDPCTVSSTSGGAQITCADGSRTYIPNPSKGAPGPAGQPGNSMVGPEGKQGSAGIPGIPAPSNYDLWLQAGNTGTLTDFLNSLKGQEGGDGRTPQFRCNPAKLQNEWRFIGDINAHPLDKVLACAPESTTWQ